MGILNVTEDSFSDGGKFVQLDAALRQAEQMLQHGADIIDIGGESTRPGATEVPLQQELDRVLPVVEAVAAGMGALVSLDTSKPEVMKAGVAAGAFMINDVRALREPGALDVAAAEQVPVCIMHMLGEPRTMQENPNYQDVVAEVGSFLKARHQACMDAGIAANNVVVDPGFGFGKTLEHNLCLLRNFDKIVDPGMHLLAGISRKRMFAAILGDSTVDRVHASVSAAQIAVSRGAAIVRVHDVEPTVHALKVYEAVFSGSEPISA